jgi:UDP-2-acetamido-2-deoxy-ribo-hexuluronate aminotransferase
MNIEMVDLKSQYQRIKGEIDEAILLCIGGAEFINGKMVNTFAQHLSSFTGAKHVIPCANGTDALQIALMALGLKPGDEVIVPAFTYAATAEVITLLHLVPVMVDVNPDTFSINLELAEKAVTSKTKAIVPVHLFGQCAEMEDLLAFANRNKLFVIEDTAQAIGAQYRFEDGTVKQSGTIGDIGATSFFPSKNLGCYGDGGALFTDNDALAKTIRMIANHGQEKKYYHDIIGVNSRLDTIQAAILDVKLKYLKEYTEARNQVAAEYDKRLCEIEGVQIPVRVANSTHVFHQYTLKVPQNMRDSLKEYLFKAGIPTMIYYPLPLHFQKAFQNVPYPPGSFPVAERLSESVISLPIHTEMQTDQLDFIIETIRNFFNNN